MQLLGFRVVYIDKTSAVESLRVATTDKTYNMWKNTFPMQTIRQKFTIAMNLIYARESVYIFY